MSFQKRQPFAFANLVAFTLLAFAAPLMADAAPAFPGAQGGGAVSKGGRGGRVIAVTSLANSGTGTLRECVLAKGPRICVFKVAGDIKLTSAIYITEPYLTVAGQTAPGGGIQISGATSSQNMIVIAAHDVVWQYTKIRKGYNPNNVGEWVQGSNIAMFSGSYNMIFDHNSIQWNQDEGIGVWSDTTNPIKNVTISNNLVAEGIYPHSTGYIVGSDSSTVAAQMTDIDFYNNLTMNNSHRNPLLTNKSSRVINNIVYNYAYYAIQAGSGVNLDVIGNKFKYGPLNAPTVKEVQLYGSQSVYMSGNVGYSQPNPSGDQWLMASQVAGQNGTDYGNPVPTSSRRSTKLPDTQYPIAVRSVDTIEALILPKAGASRRLACDGSWVSNRDTVDLRLVNQYQTNTGISKLPKDHAEVGGYPVIASGTPCADADNDGMPDVWESARGLNPNNAADAITDRNADGFTNIEEYLAGPVARDPASPSPTPAPNPLPSPSPSPSPAPAPGISNVTATNDATNVIYSYSFSGAPGFLRVFIDSDRNAGTGYAVRGIGADYLIENENLYKHSGTGTGWSFVAAGSSNMVKSTSSIKWTLARSALSSPSAVYLIANADNEAYSSIVSQTIVSPSPSPTPLPTVGVSNVSVTNDATNVAVALSYSGAPGFLRIFIDSDRNAGTGYAIRGIGADYLVENDNLYKHSGTGTGWSFAALGSAKMVKSSSSVSWTLARSALGSPSALNLIANADNDAYSSIVSKTLVTATPTPTPAPVGTRITMSNVKLESGNAYVIYATFPTAGDKKSAPRQSRLQIYENGVALGPAHSAHADIRSLGRGRFSHWGNSLRFSASDNTNPKTNGRTYTYKVLSAPAP